MGTNAVEKQAQELNKLLRAKSKTLDKKTRVRIRGLLGETFAALEARPLDGQRCLALAAQIDREIAALKGEMVAEAVAVSDGVGEASSREMVDVAPERVPEGEVATESAPGHAMAADAASDHGAARESRDGDVPGKVGADASDEEGERMREAHSEPAARIAEGDSAAEGEPRIPAGDSGAGDASPARPETPKEPEIRGFAEMIHLQIRCFVRVRACVQPAELGKVAKFSSRFSDGVQERVDKFLAVLSKGEDDFSAKVDVETGYQQDLLPNMPDRNLVLHQKLKKKKKL